MRIKGRTRSSRLGARLESFQLRFWGSNHHFDPQNQSGFPSLLWHSFDLTWIRTTDEWTETPSRPAPRSPCRHGTRSCCRVVECGSTSTWSSTQPSSLAHSTGTPWPRSSGVSSSPLPRPRRVCPSSKESSSKPPPRPSSASTGLCRVSGFAGFLTPRLEIGITDHGIEEGAGTDGRR